MECFDLAPSLVVAALLPSLLCFLLVLLSLSMIFDVFDTLVLQSSSNDWAEELRFDFLGAGKDSECWAAAALKREARVVLIGTEVEAVARFSSEEDLRCSAISSEGGRSLLVRLKLKESHVSNSAPVGYGYMNPIRGKKIV